MGDGDLEVEVTVGAAGRADLARARQLQPQPRLDATGNVDRHGAARAHATLALARGARVRDRRAVALAGRARLRRDDVAEQAADGALHLAGAVADVARDGLGARLAARALARLAEDRGVDLEVAMRAEDDVLQVEGDAHEGILAPFSTRPGAPAAAARSAAEERLEDVAEATEVRAATERRAVAAHVVALTLLGVAQHVVRVRHELESLGRLFPRVHIRVQLARETAVRLLDLFGARVTRDAQYFVVVGHNRLSCPLRARWVVRRCGPLSGTCRPRRAAD